MKIKICGLKTYDEAIHAVESGADLLGFNFYPPSPRYLAPLDCAHLVARLQAVLGDSFQHITLVGVFVNCGAEQVQDILSGCGLHLAQLSGDETPEFAAALGERAFKALRITAVMDIDQALSRYPQRGAAPAFLIDSYRQGAYGGTGEVADWSLASRAAARRPVLLAGGLTPENVPLAIRQVQPWGVDVASGVESAPGKKDPLKVAAFIRAARRFEEEKTS